MSTPLARLLAMAYRQLVDDLHRSLAARGVERRATRRSGSCCSPLREGPVSLRELVATLGTSKQAVSKLADAMAAAGLVERAADPRDARAKDLRLTARGRALLADVEEIYGELEAGGPQPSGRTRSSRCAATSRRWSGRPTTGRSRRCARRPDPAPIMGTS